MKPCLHYPLLQDPYSSSSPLSPNSPGGFSVSGRLRVREARAHRQLLQARKATLALHFLLMPEDLTVAKQPVECLHRNLQWRGALFVSSGYFFQFAEKKNLAQTKKEKRNDALSNTEAGGKRLLSLLEGSSAMCPRSKVGIPSHPPPLPQLLHNKYL